MAGRHMHVRVTDPVVDKAAAPFPPQRYNSPCKQWSSFLCCPTRPGARLPDRAHANGGAPQACGYAASPFIGGHHETPHAPACDLDYASFL